MIASTNTPWQLVVSMAVSLDGNVEVEWFPHDDSGRTLEPLVAIESGDLAATYSLVASGDVICGLELAPGNRLGVSEAIDSPALAPLIEAVCSNSDPNRTLLLAKPRVELSRCFDVVCWIGPGDRSSKDPRNVAVESVRSSSDVGSMVRDVSAGAVKIRSVTQVGLERIEMHHALKAADPLLREFVTESSLSVGKRLRNPHLRALLNVRAGITLDDDLLDRIDRRDMKMTSTVERLLNVLWDISDNEDDFSFAEATICSDLASTLELGFYEI